MLHLFQGANGDEMIGKRARLYLVAGAAFVVASLGLPSLAGANVYCVDVVGGDCTDTSTDFQDALNDAAANVGDDRVRLGAATYSSSVDPNAFSYVGGDGAVEIIGSGQAMTTVTMPTPANMAGFQQYTLLNLDASGGGPTLSALTMQLPAPTPGGDQFLGLAGAGTTTVEDVGVVSSAPGTAINGTAIQIFGGTVDDTSVQLPLDVGIEGSLGIHSLGTAEVTDTDVRADTGLNHSGGPLDALRLELEVRLGIQVAGGTANVRSSTIDLGSTNGGRGVVVEFNNPTGTTIDAVVDGVTIVGDGPNSVGIRAAGLDNGDVTTATVNNTIMDLDLDTTIHRLANNTGEANVSTNYSNYDGTTIVSDNNVDGAGTVTEGNRTNFVPGFVDPAGGDFHLLSTSPLLDIGDPAPPLGGATDLDGDARALDAFFDCAFIQRRDIGADEFSGATQGVPAACLPPVVQPPLAPATPSTGPTSLRKKCKKRKKKPRTAAAAKKRRCKRPRR